MDQDQKNENLEAALEKLGKVDLFIPPDIDEKIISAAATHFKSRASEPIVSFPRWRGWVAGAAAAAVAVIAITRLEFRSKSNLAADVNRDGVVDVLDALVLAQSAAQGRGGVDVNRDGAFDGLDANALLNRLVKVENGGAL